MAINRTKVGDAWKKSLVCSHPAAPASGDPVRFGGVTGVALDAERTDGTTSVDLGPGEWDMSVKGIDDDGNSAVAVGDGIYYVDADTPVLSKKATGYLFGVALEIVTSGSTGTIMVQHLPTQISGTIGVGDITTAKLADNAVDEDKLKDGLIVGTIQLDIFSVHILSSNDYLATSEGGFPDTNTAPLLERVNSATDIASRLVWAAASVVELQFATVAKPADLDEAQDVTVHLMTEKDADANTFGIGVKFFDGKGDTSVGGSTGTVAQALGESTITVLAAGIAASPGFFNVALVPEAHAGDALHLYAAWLEYTRKG